MCVVITGPLRKSARVASQVPTSTDPGGTSDDQEDVDPSATEEQSQSEDYNDSATEGNNSDSGSEEDVENDDVAPDDSGNLDSVADLDKDSFIIYKIAGDDYYLLGQVLWVDMEHKPQPIVSVLRYGLVKNTANTWEKKRNNEGECEDYVRCPEIVKWNFSLQNATIPHADLRYFPRIRKDKK